MKLLCCQLIIFTPFGSHFPNLHVNSQLTCDGERDQTALREEVMRKNIDVINTAVASLVGGLCSRKQEVGGVIDSWLGVVECWGGGGEVELEGASWVLWLDGAADGEGWAPEHVKPLLLGLGDPVHGGGPRDVGLKQQVCKHREMIGWELGHVQSENNVHWFATVSGLNGVFPPNGAFPLIWWVCQRCYPISSDVHKPCRIIKAVHLRSTTECSMHHRFRLNVFLCFVDPPFNKMDLILCLLVSSILDAPAAFLFVHSDIEEIYCLTWSWRIWICEYRIQLK